MVYPNMGQMANVHSDEDGAYLLVIVIAHNARGGSLAEGAESPHDVYVGGMVLWPQGQGPLPPRRKRPGSSWRAPARSLLHFLLRVCFLSSLVPRNPRNMGHMPNGRLTPAHPYFYVLSTHGAGAL